MPDHSPYVDVRRFTGKEVTTSAGKSPRGAQPTSFPPGALQVRRTKPHDVGAGLLAGT